MNLMHRDRVNSTHSIVCITVSITIGLASFFLSQSARAHDPPRAFGITWSEASADEFVVRTNRGLVFNKADGARLLCHAGIGAHQSERMPLVPLPDGGWLVGTSLGLLHLDAHGCPDEPSPRLQQGAVQDLRQHPGQAALLYAVTADSSVGSALYRSQDAGVNFELLSSLAATEYFSSVAIDRGSVDRVYLGGARVDLDTQQVQHFVASWSESADLQIHPVSLLSSETQIRVMSVDPNRPRIAAQTIASSASQEPDRLLVSGDEGNSWDPMLAAMGIAQLDFSPVADRAWLASADGLFQSEGGGAFVRVPLVHPPSCVVEKDEQQLIVCDAVGVHRSTDQGSNLSSVLAFQDVTAPVSCDGTSEPLPVCREQWQHFQEELQQAQITDGGGSTAPATAASGSGCGIGSRPTAGVGWLLLATLALAWPARGVSGFRLPRRRSSSFPGSPRRARFRSPRKRW